MPLDEEMNSINPYVSPVPDDGNERKGKLACPHCGDSYFLTWSRYWREGSGKHVCPSCGLKSRLKVTPAYLVKALGTIWGSIAIAVAMCYSLTPATGYWLYFILVPRRTRVWTCNGPKV